MSALQRDERENGVCRDVFKLVLEIWPIPRPDLIMRIDSAVEYSFHLGIQRTQLHGFRPFVCEAGVNFLKNGKCLGDDILLVIINRGVLDWVWVLGVIVIRHSWFRYGGW